MHPISASHVDPMCNRVKAPHPKFVSLAISSQPYITLFFIATHMAGHLINHTSMYATFGRSVQNTQTEATA